nr:sigma 54-interacting transcriptional regulator [candidate division Zixibacteria bacterium]
MTEIPENNGGLARLSELFLKFSANAIILADLSGKIKWINQTACDFLDYSLAEIVDRQIPGVYGQWPENNWDTFYRNLSEKKEISFKTEYHSKSGAKIPVEVNANYLDLGFARFICCIIRDISAIQYPDETLRLMYYSIDRASDAVYWLKEDTSIVYVNEAACRALGYTRDELLHMSILDIDPNFNIDIWPEHWSRIKDYKSKIFETQHRAKSGEIIPVEISANFIKFGKNEYHCSFARNITRRKKYESEIRKESSLRKAIIGKGADGICVCHEIPDYPYVKFTVWNERMVSLTGYTMDDINKLGWYQTMYPDLDYQKKAVERMALMRQGIDIEGEEWVIKRADGQDRTILISTSVLETNENDAHVIAMMLDITERKKAEEDLRRAMIELENLKNRLQDENIYLRQEIKDEYNYDQIIGRSQALNDIMEKVTQVANTSATVLITGETGTGKELIARAIHEHSQRAEQPMIKVNCASIPKDLFESEFFGHVKGAFTGAHQDRVGRFQLADGGTLFLDEVGEIPIELQGKLLRVLQEGQFERVGEDITRTVDVRIIASTNRLLEQEVVNNHFRQDLYFRLSVFPIEVPPLRERLDDIPLLAKHFMRLSCRRIGIPDIDISENQINLLKSYAWPGNIRELQNIIERAVIKSRLGEFKIELPAEAFGPDMVLKPKHDRLILKSAGVISHSDLRKIEKENIMAALETSHWKVYGSGGAAERLGMKPSTLSSRIKALGIKRSGDD